MTHTVGNGSNGYPINQTRTVTKEFYESLLADREIAAHAKKLALALECLLLECEETSATSKWWGMAYSAIHDYHDDIDRLYPQDHVSPLGKD